MSKNFGENLDEILFSTGDSDSMKIFKALQANKLKEFVLNKVFTDKKEKLEILKLEKELGLEPKKETKGDNFLMLSGHVFDAHQRQKKRNPIMQAVHVLPQAEKKSFFKEVFLKTPKGIKNILDDIILGIPTGVTRLK